MEQERDTSHEGICNNDEVRLLHSPGLAGVVSGVCRDGIWVCMPIAGRYQLRGPFAPDDLEVTRRASQDTREGAEQ